eukprot:Rhum_TRINITY_DN7662_c0_g2::Rhum_TRINITY_DN7662_c0_g2_i1::g.23706::m.23706/K03283/HSPA1s; heat shock 70kDa protein 1/2/6/8
MVQGFNPSPLGRSFGARRGVRRNEARSTLLGDDVDPREELMGPPRRALQAEGRERTACAGPLLRHTVAASHETKTALGAFQDRGGLTSLVATLPVAADSDDDEDVAAFASTTATLPQSFSSPAPLQSPQQQSPGGRGVRTYGSPPVLRDDRSPRRSAAASAAAAAAAARSAGAVSCVNMTAHAHMDHQESKWGPLRPGAAAPPVGLNKNAATEEYTPCLGIDLGATNTCVAAWNGKAAVVLRSFQNSSCIIPSVVAYTDKDTLVGHAAVKQWVGNPSDTIFSSKRWLARSFDKEAAAEAEKLPYKVKAAENGQCAIQVAHRSAELGLVTPEQLTSTILEYAKDIAVSEHLRRDVRDAVITVPAGYTDEQKVALMAAADLAGLRVMLMQSDPVAAAIACGLHCVKADENLWQRKSVMVVDCGGSTLQVTVMVLDGKRFEIVATGEDPALGGDDFDEAIAQFFLKDITKKLPHLPTDKDGVVKLTVQERIRLRLKSRDVKEALGGIATQMFEFDVGGSTYSGNFTRARLDMVCSKLVGRVMQTVESVLKQSGLHKGSIDDVVLAGGSTKMKKLQDTIESFFKGFRAFVVKTETPDELVAQGAAVKAAIMVEAATKIPPPTLPVVSNVVPQAIGVSLNNDQYCTVINRNTSVPSSQKLERYYVYHTTSPNQSSLNIHVYQGEAPRASDNFYLGSCLIENIPPKPAGEVDVCVKYTFYQSGLFEAVGWVQGMGHITTSVLVTNDAYERLDVPAPTGDGGGVAGSPTQRTLARKTSLGKLNPRGHRASGEQAGGAASSEVQSIALGADFFVASAEVPKDAEDRRIDEARAREHNKMREEKRREKREAKERDKQQQKEDHERRNTAPDGSALAAAAATAGAGGGGGGLVSPRSGGAPLSARGPRAGGTPTRATPPGNFLKTPELLRAGTVGSIQRQSPPGARLASNSPVKQNDSFRGAPNSARGPNSARAPNSARRQK